MKPLKEWNFEVYLALIIGISLALGAGIQGVVGVGRFLPGFVAGSLITFFGLFIMLIVWHWAGSGKGLAWMMLVAFGLRIVLAVFLIVGLPNFGYDNDEQQAGFVFNDAYRREGTAWALAQSDDSLLKAFDDELGSDQYGGMLLMSALVYRVLSPDAFRPVLISIISATAMSLSIPILLATIQRKFNQRVAVWAGWIMALYPEGILLGASQMREPLMILLITVLIWAVSHWLERVRVKLATVVFALDLILFLLLSYRVAIPCLGVVGLWIWIVESSRIKKLWPKLAGWLVIALGGLASLAFFKPWLDQVLRWDTHLTVINSGMVNYLVASMPKKWIFPFVVGYGFFQPVLPAALVTSAPAIWKGIGIIRSLGWYALIPLLVYAAVRLWTAESKSRRQWLGVFMAVVVVWILIASARAGGDQWDNPRYRTIFLPWMALLAGWGMDYLASHKDRWFWRILAMEIVFLLVFTEWYFSRYLLIGPKLSFPVIVGLIVGINLLILGGGLVRDLRERKRALTD
ncbi:MAG: hypothetical protein H0S82_08330 [Anaerolineaceae bacterium]|nr:hypothetical protein [Anaerolineaceae bacterium]